MKCQGIIKSKANQIKEQGIKSKNKEKVKMVYDSISPLGTKPMRSHEIPWSMHVKQDIKGWGTTPNKMTSTTKCWWAYRKLYPPETPYSLITEQTTFSRHAYKDNSIQDLT